MVGVDLQEVHRTERLMHAYQRFPVGGNFAFHQCQMGFARQLVHINVLAELAPRRMNQRIAHLLQQAFRAAAVFD